MIMEFVKHSNISNEERAKLADIEGSMLRRLFLYPNGFHTDTCEGDCYLFQETDMYISIYNCHGTPEPNTLLLVCHDKSKYADDKVYYRGDYVQLDESSDYYLCIDEGEWIKGIHPTDTSKWIHFKTDENMSTW